MPTKKKSIQKKPSLPKTPADAPATQRMLFLVRDELKADVAGVRSDLRSEAKGLRADMGELKNGLRSEMAELKTELRSEMSELKTELRSDMAQLKTELRSDMAELKTELRSDMAELSTKMEAFELRTDGRFEMVMGQFDQLSAEIHQIKILAEHQRAENRIVMDALQSSIRRHDQAEGRLDDLEGFYSRVKKLEKDP